MNNKGAKLFEALSDLLIICFDSETRDEVKRFIDDLDSFDNITLYENDLGLVIGCPISRLVELKGFKKSDSEWLPYYDMDALRSAYDNPEYKWRTNFRFSNGTEVDIRDGKPYLNKGAVAEVGDMCLGVQGTIGEIFYVREKCYITESVKRVQFKYNLLLPELFAFWVESKLPEILKANQSQMIPSLNQSAFNKMLIPLYPLPAQEIICRKLNILKARLTEYESQNQQLETDKNITAEYLFQELKESEKNYG